MGSNRTRRARTLEVCLLFPPAMATICSAQARSSSSSTQQIKSHPCRATHTRSHSFCWIVDICGSSNTQGGINGLCGLKGTLFPHLKEIRYANNEFTILTLQRSCGSRGGLVLIRNPALSDVLGLWYPHTTWHLFYLGSSGIFLAADRRERGILGML
jgi:hypothetical protein